MDTLAIRVLVLTCAAVHDAQRRFAALLEALFS